MVGVEEISWPPRDPEAINQMEKVCTHMFTFLWPRHVQHLVYKGTHDINVLTGNDTTGKRRAIRQRVSFRS